MTKKLSFGFVAGVLVLAALIFINHKKNPDRSEQRTIQPTETNVQNSSAVSNDNLVLVPAVSIPQPTSNPPLETVALTNSVEERIHNLEELGTRGDSDSFQTIISELKSSDHEIREAALAAAMQFGSRDAIPILKDLATQTEDAREKVAILDAIDFLALPSVAEVRQRRMKTNSAGASSVRTK